MLKKPGRPAEAPLDSGGTTLIFEAYSRFKVNALTLERLLRHVYGVNLPHNRIYTILKENGRALPQPAKQRRRRWVRYELEHSMGLRGRSSRTVEASPTPKKENAE